MIYLTDSRTKVSEESIDTCNVQEVTRSIPIGANQVMWMAKRTDLFCSIKDVIKCESLMRAGPEF